MRGGLGRGSTVSSDEGLGYTKWPPMHFLLKEVFHKGLRHLSVVSDLMEAMISKSMSTKDAGGISLLGIPSSQQEQGFLST